MEDALSLVKRRPDMFPRQNGQHGRQPGLGLVEHLMRDALVYGNRACEVFQAEEWWFVVSETDWLLLGAHEDQVGDAFYQIIATPEIEDHGLRAEILLNAFADAVWVIAPTGYKMIKGVELQRDQLKRLIDARQLTRKWRRIVAFWVNAKPDTSGKPNI